MSTLYRDPGSRSQTLASCGTRDPPLDKYTVDHQSSRAKAPRAGSAVASLAVAALLTAAPELAVAQSLQTDSSAAARAGAIAHAQKMRRLFPDIGGDMQATPPVIPELEIDLDPGGAIATFQPKGSTVTAKNAFFQDLGTNGRTCFTCHQPQDGWSLSAEHAQDRFYANSNDPLFRLVDGATCPSDDVSTHRAKRKAYSLLLAEGLDPDRSADAIRWTGVPDHRCERSLWLQYEPDDGSDRLHDRHSVCLSPTVTRSQSWLSEHHHVGRARAEPIHQAVDATLGHAQAAVAPTAEQQQQIVTFEGCTQANTPAAVREYSRPAPAFSPRRFSTTLANFSSVTARRAGRFLCHSRWRSSLSE